MERYKARGTRIASIAWMAAGGFLVFAGISCDSEPLTVPTGSEELRVCIDSWYNDDLVVLELDGDVVFARKVSTDSRVGMAEVVTLSLPPGEHSLRAVVNREARSRTTFTAGNTASIVVRYDESHDDVDLFVYHSPCIYH